MKKYKKLLEYISVFEDETIELCTWVAPESKEDGVLTIGYPKYDDKLDQFIKDVYESDIMRGDYLEYLEKNVVDSRDLTKHIPTADLGLLKAIFTYYVRQERFYEGLWVQAVKDKTFLHILKRLSQIDVDD